jgi:hypothetical protein
MKLRKLTQEQWLRLAVIIDTDFIGSEKTFTAEKINGYYYLTTNKCDHASTIKVFEPDLLGNYRIIRDAEDTDGYKEISLYIYKKVVEYLKQLEL